MEVNYPSKIDVSRIEYSDMRSFGDHAKIIYINYKSKPIILQTPLMVCPYGLGRYDGGEKPKFSLDLSFRGMQESPQIAALHEFLTALDDKIIMDSTTQSLAWFKKKTQTRDVSLALFSPSIKTATENGEATDKYPPTFKVKVSHYDDQFKVLCYDDSRAAIEADLPKLIGKGQTIRAIVKLGGVWFAGGKFGMTWEIIQMKLTPRSELTACAFVDEDDDESSDNNTDFHTPRYDERLNNKDDNAPCCDDDM
jgi:hypothetical protein